MYNTNLKSFLLCCFALTTFFSFSQEKKSEYNLLEELSDNFYEKDSLAKAVVLERNEKISFVFNSYSGFEKVREVYERRKVFLNNGEHSKIKERLIDNEGRKDKIKNFKATVYNLKDNAIHSQQIKKSERIINTFKAYDELIYTLPDLKDGGIVEYNYTVVSKYDDFLGDIHLQRDIPIKKQSVHIEIPFAYEYGMTFYGDLTYAPKKNIKKHYIQRYEGGCNHLLGECSVSIECGGVRVLNTESYQVSSLKYSFKDIPAYQIRDVVLEETIDYPAKISIDLKSTIS